MSAFEPYIALLKEKIKEFKDWVKPNPEDAIGIQILKTLLKIPIILLAILVSPLALIVLVFAFVAAF